MIGRLLVAAILCGGTITTAFAQDIALGAISFKKCAICHDVGPTAKNKVGPMLNGLANRNSGSVAGYKYSEANKKSGIVWGEATFLEYIKNPKAKIPGTKMIFAGLRSETEAKNLWAYLSKFGSVEKDK